MYTKKQKIEIYISFFLALFVVEIFNITVARKGILQIYSTNQTLPWILPYHWLYPIWTALYTLLAVAGAMIYVKRPLISAALH